MRKTKILVILAVLLLPISASAYSVKVDIYSPWNSGYSQVHGHTSITNLVGSIYGEYNETYGSLSYLSGNLFGTWGKLAITDGYFNRDGSGELDANIFGFNPKKGGLWNYSGKFTYFADSTVDNINPYRYNNIVTSSHLKVWGGGKFDSGKLTWSGLQGQGKKWLGADLYGKVVKLPEPNVILLLLMSLLGVGLFEYYKKLSARY
ncbi:MAG: hypothetical protein AAF304_03610 [Pseudomonadota bacterium]